MFQYFETPSYAILLNSSYFSIFAFLKNVIGPHLHLGMSQNVQNLRHYEFSRFTGFEQL